MSVTWHLGLSQCHPIKYGIVEAASLSEVYASVTYTACVDIYDSACRPMHFVTPIDCAKTKNDTYRSINI